MSKPGLELRAVCGALVLSAAACGKPSQPEPDPPLPKLPWSFERGPQPEVDSPLTAIVGGKVMTAAGSVIEDGIVVLHQGRVRAVGPPGEITLAPEARRIDASGRFVTPGLIDVHSHMGVYPVPAAEAHRDGNEATAPVTAHVDAADSFWPQDPALRRALAAGVTTIQVLPGSANLIGGRGAIMKLRPGRSADAMRFPGAPVTLKMACGENPKRVYGKGKKAAPATRMGNVAGYRTAYQKAREYGRSWSDWQQRQRLWAIKRAKFERAKKKGEKGGEQDRGRKGTKPPQDPGPEPAPPPRDFGLETLLGVIEGHVHVQMHCYRADEMLRMIELAERFGFRIRAFHHAVEAYKIRDVLREKDVGTATWADWWGFKLEAFDTIVENLALLTETGARGVLHSDSPMLVQRLNQEAAKARHAGLAAGIDVSEDQALRWITSNAAWALGIDDRTGSLEVGKMADLVVWSGSPFSVYARADLVFVDGELLFDRAKQVEPQASDFELGLGVRSE
ncbi:MAG: amidohydrolase [Proteobacteria bacterium]|nr:amidohydrolase [Pseudomonadota bacterium]